MAPSDDDQAKASIREVTALVEASRREILAEIEKLAVKVDAKFDTHTAKHENDRLAHLDTHQRDNDRRTGYLRWAVTTLMTGLGTLIALYVAFKR